MTVEQFKGARGLPIEISALKEVRDSFTDYSYRKYVDGIIARRVMQQIEVEQIIDQINDPFQKRVISSYIIDGRATLDVIACEEHYCLRTISRAFRAGIDDLISKGLLTDTENT